MTEVGDVVGVFGGGIVFTMVSANIEGAAIVVVRYGVAALVVLAYDLKRLQPKQHATDADSSKLERERQIGSSLPSRGGSLSQHGVRPVSAPPDPPSWHAGLPYPAWPVSPACGTCCSALRPRGGASG